MKQTRHLIGVNEIGYPVGESHHRAKLTDRDVDQIHDLAAAGLSSTLIAAKFDDIAGGISPRTVRAILSGKIRGQTPTAHKPPKSR